MSDDDPSLEVTLRLARAVRSWRIGRSWNVLEWRYEQHGPDGVAAGESLTLSQALETRRAFDAEIATAREDGWS